MVYNKAMDAKQVKELTGLTYGQLNYLVDQVDALKREKTQGKARDFTFRDLALLKLASLMRSDGISTRDISEGVALADRHSLKGEMFYYSEASRFQPLEDKFFEIWKGAEGRRDTDVFTMPKWIYIVTDETAKEKRIMNFDKLPNHIPKFFYRVSAIASELAKGDQLELDLMSEVEAVN